MNYYFAHWKTLQNLPAMLDKVTVLLYRLGYQFKMPRLLLVNSWKGHQSFWIRKHDVLFIVWWLDVRTEWTALPRFCSNLSMAARKVTEQILINRADSCDLFYVKWERHLCFLKKKLSCRLYSMVVDVQLLIYFNSTLIYNWLDDVIINFIL